MKISWGYKILFVYLAFVIGILFMVYKASREKFDLVTPDYYDAELKFQNVIDDKQRTAELSAPPKITHSVNAVSIQLSDEFLNKDVKGELFLYRPSDASKDVKRSFNTNKSFVEIPLDKELSGAYEIKLSWKASGKTFYNEQRIFF
jgi:nitrogen fixation protein FixH